MISTLFVYSSSKKQTLRVVFFDHSKKQKFGYFCPFGTFFFFSSISIFAVYMFFLLLPLRPAKTFVFRVSKNICLSCHQKHFAFSRCRVIRVLHSEEKLTCSGLTVELRIPHRKEAIKSNYFVRIKAVPLTLRAVRKRKYSFKVNYSFVDLKTNVSR